MQATEKKRSDREKLTKAQRWRVADRLAEDRLPYINTIITPAKPKKSFYGTYIKRLIDIAVSLTVLIITLPLNLIIGIITLFDVGLPLFYTHKRAGKDGKVFLIVKFRNMTNETDASGELLPASERVTKWGRLVRKTSLDELLNFWSILKGDMSLIGPRPLPPEYVHRYNDRHKMRLKVRPGLECPPHETADRVRSWQEQLENDIWYVENIGFQTDCIMLLRLLQFALNRKNSAARADIKLKGIFMGYDENGKAINLDGVPDQYITQISKEESNGLYQ